MNLKRPANYTNEVPFHFVLMAYAGVLLYHSRDLSREAALVPRMMGVALIVVAIARVITILAPSYVPDSLLEIGFDPGEMADLGGDQPGARKVLTIIAWVVTYVVLMYLLGIVFGTFLFVFLYVYFWGDKGVLVSGGFALAMVLFLEYVFSRFLRINLKGGVVDVPFLPPF